MQEARELPKNEQISLRVATEEDAAILFAWRNEPTTRSMFFSQEEVDWDSHVRWLGKVLQDPAETPMVGQCDGTPIGIVRFGRSNAGITVSLTISPEHRNKGYGRRLLHEGLATFRKSNPDSAFLAAVRVENLASLRVFQACGFAEMSRDDVAVLLACAAEK